ncbi:hypothetical protein F4824DRAFT_475966 [Ustulina deusta]|nr:hypothetical protein F4824DRAFT_475966 [Ustulina deusta]
MQYNTTLDVCVTPQASEQRPPMDQLERWKLPTRASRSRTATPSAGKTTIKDNHQSARSQTKKTRRKHDGARKKNVIFVPEQADSVLNLQCRTEEAYTCHLSLLVLLHTKSYNTLHPVRQDDSQRSIEFDFASFPSASYRVLFYDLLEAL